MVSIKDLAEMTGYSVATISRVINNTAGVTDKARAKVMAAIEETGYHPNFIGRNLRTSSSKKILILLPTLKNTFYADILPAADNSAAAAGYQTIIGCTQNNPSVEARYIDMVKSRQVDGIILANTILNKDEINELSSSFPVVLMAHKLEGVQASSVSINNTAAAYDATNYLISLGHKNISMLSGIFYQNPSLERELGFKNALEDSSMHFSASNILRTDFDFKSGYSACEKLLHARPETTAIFCVADSIAIGAIKYLAENNLDKEISVVGFDNVMESEYFHNGVTTINQPKKLIGSTCVELLLKQIDEPGSPVESRILPHELIVRGSTRQI